MQHLSLLMDPEDPEKRYAPIWTAHAGSRHRVETGSRIHRLMIGFHNPHPVLIITDPGIYACKATLQASGSIPASSRARQLVSTIMRCWGLASWPQQVKSERIADQTAQYHRGMSRSDTHQADLGCLQTSRQCAYFPPLSGYPSQNYGRKQANANNPGYLRHLETCMPFLQLQGELCPDSSLQKLS